MPVDPQLWKELAIRGGSSRGGDQFVAVGWIREALKHKEGKAKGTLLALDASHFGAMVGPKLVNVYLSTYGNPEEIILKVGQ